MADIDLTALEAAEREATAGDWSVQTQVTAGGGHVTTWGVPPTQANLQLVVALRNAAPELLRRARMLERLMEALPKCDCGRAAQYRGDDGEKPRAWCASCVPPRGGGKWSTKLPWADVVREAGQ